MKISILPPLMKIRFGPSGLFRITLNDSRIKFTDKRKKNMKKVAISRKRVYGILAYSTV